jgi:capsid protein
MSTAHETIGQGVSGYDAATNSPARSQFIAFPTNSRIEFSSYTRKEITRKSRALSANLPIVGRLQQVLAEQSVGSGIFATAMTDDNEWNAAADRLVDEVGGNPGTYSIDASRTLYEDQRLIAETVPEDGEYFSVLVKGESGYPFVQPLDVYEIETPTGTMADPLINWEDGILLNPQLRPSAYSVRELPRALYGDTLQFRSVRASDMIHIFRRRRAKQFRGLPWIHAGLNSGTDVLDLQSLETATAKLHAAMAVTVKRTGRKGRQGAVGKIQGATTDLENTAALEKVFGGAMINYLGEDGEVQLVSSSRPSPDLVKFCEYLMRVLALGYNIPIQYVWDPGSLGGATSRSVLEDVQRTCGAMQEMIVERHTRRWRTWRLWWAMEHGELPKCKDKEWWKCAFRGPAKLTVDIGRTADAAIKLMKNGALSLHRYYEERNQSPHDEIRSHLRLVKWAMDEAERLGVPATMIFEPTPGSQQPATPDDVRKALNEKDE